VPAIHSESSKMSDNVKDRKDIYVCGSCCKDHRNRDTIAKHSEPRTAHVYVDGVYP
jgi:hypothetical protein